MTGEARQSEGKRSAEERRQLVIGIACAFCGAICWGFSGTCANYLFDTYHISATWLVSFRLMIAGTLFMIIAFATQRDKLFGLLRDLRMLGRCVIVALIGVLLIQVSYMLSIKYCGAGTALLLQQTGLVIIMIVTCVKAMRLPNARELICLALAIAGVWFIATQGNPGELSINPLGLFWGLVAGLALACHNLLPIPVMEKYGNVVMNGVTFWMAAIALVPFERPWETHVEMGVDGWFAFVAIILLGTFLAYFLYMQGVRKAGPMRASLIAVMEPASAQVFCFLWMAIVPTAWDFVGCVLILSMMVLISLPAKSKAGAAEPEGLEAVEPLEPELAASEESEPLESEALDASDESPAALRD